MTQPTPPTKGEDTFLGWYSDEGLNNLYNFNTPVTSNLNLYAKWGAPTPITYTITFNASENGGQTDASLDPQEPGYVVNLNEFTAIREG